MKDIRYCPKCGKQIDADSTFCTHCGFTLNAPIKTNFWSKLANNQRIGVVITGLWILIQFCFFVSEPNNYVSGDTTLWFFDSDFTDFSAYGLGEFVFYGLLVPAIVWGLIYIFPRNKKVGIGLSTGLAVSLLLFWGTGKYQDYKKDREQRKPIINREFLSCALGEDYSSVLQKVRKEYSQCIVDSLSSKESLVLSKVSYGSRLYNSMSFDFYKGRLYQVCFKKNFNTEDDKLSAYENFKEIFKQKNYPRDYEKYKKYSNSYYYIDKHTELQLRYSVYEYDGGEQYVQLFYYDLNSHQKDEGL